MLLSLQQRYIVEVLDKLGCLRRDQIYILTRDHFQTEDFTITEKRMEAMLRQLPILNGNIRVDEQYVRYAAAEPEPMLLEAIDVMLELSNGYPIHFSVVRDSAALLNFALGGDPPRRFMVADYTGSVLGFSLSGNVVWISESGLAPDNL